MTLAFSLTPTGYRDIGLEHWFLAERGAYDPLGVVLADGHYSRRKPGSPKFLPPGQRFVLISRDGRAVWGWWRSKGVVAMNGLDGWTCVIFRRLAGPRASALVLDAERAIGRLGFDCGPDGLLTYVFDRKVRSGNPGYCYKLAGWHIAGRCSECVAIKPRSADGLKTLLHKPFSWAGRT